MNISEAQAVHAPLEPAVYKEVTGELVGEAIASIAVMALAIVGLANTFATTMAAIATIVLGASILIESGLFAGTAEVLQREEWLSSRCLGGLTGVVLGILALLGIVPDVLLAAAVIVFGAGVLFSSIADAPVGGSALMGLGAVVLGILGVVGLDRLTLVLVALLCLGAMALFIRAGNVARLAMLRRNHRATVH